MSGQLFLLDLIEKVHLNLTKTKLISANTDGVLYLVHKSEKAKFKEVCEGVAHTFPSNYRIALEALNTGRPVVLDNHNKLAAALTGFARGLVETVDEPAASKRQPGLLGRLTGRRG
jgi:NAD-dependent oxidoreductase involved in siderophore biosynthesis